MPFLMGLRAGLPVAKRSYVSKTQTHQIVIFVQERLPEMPVLLSIFLGGLIVHQLESLILAQNERWRHA